MNAHSFERELRDLDPPMAAPEAKARAKQAAMAEFERLHASQDPIPSRDTRKKFAWLQMRPVWGGLATACVALVAVSLVWLAPSDERAIRLPVEPVVELPEAEAAPLSGQSVAAPVPPPPRVAMDIVAPTPRTSQETAASRDALEPAVRAQQKASEESVRQERAREGEQSASRPTAVASVTDRPAPAVVMPPPPAFQGAGGLPDGVAEIAVTGSRITANAALTSRMPAIIVPSPAAPGAGRFSHFETNGVKRVADESVSTFSVDVDTASYSVVRRQINEGELPPADAVRVEEMINYFDYAWPAATSRREPFRPTIAVSDSPWTQGRKLVHIGIKGYELPVRAQPDANLVLLLDVSGSMNSPDKLPLAQQSMAMLLETLKPTDTVAIVVYAGAAGQVLAPTPVSERETILRALYSLRPGGSTAGAAGIRLAYELAERNFRREGVNRILLATDGDFNVGISDVEELKSFVARERGKGVFLSVLGFGTGNYRDDMAQVLAQNGNGVAAYIDTAAEARKVLVEQATSSLFTIAKDVKLQVEFNPATVAEYRLIGYETRALNEEDFNNDRVDAGDVGSGHTVTAIYEITPVGSNALSTDARRYADAQPARAPRSRTSEYGFLRIRYKLPDSDRSRLIEEPIRVNAGVPSALRQDVTFSTAVAGFGQLLRDDRHVGEWDFNDVIRMAQPAVGEDTRGYRAEFVQLVRRAQAMDRAMNSPVDSDE